ncbi:hypothetical protein DL98DRAFT_179421 [Cadophora sp. DSE1049]|nr:hypothetical protein DL98DRAFT_179421 [Cadophora sp. DSE1049]
MQVELLSLYERLYTAQTYGHTHMGRASRAGEGVERLGAFSALALAMLGAIACAGLRNHAALAPSIARVGDTIMLVKGSRVPLIFRERGTSWELIGNAFVPGVMKGEQWNEKRCQTIRII